MCQLMSCDKRRVSLLLKMQSATEGKHTAWRQATLAARPRAPGSWKLLAEQRRLEGLVR